MAARRALVTGGGSGIGLAIARALADAGFETTVAGRNRERLRACGLPFFLMDVTNESEVEAAFRKHGPFDIVVANAGAVKTAPLVKTSRESWDEMLAVNLTGVFLCARYGVPAMIDKGWGRFIAVASIAGLRGAAYAGAYAAAKHGVLGLIKSLAIELGKTGVTANALCPGYTDTDMVERSVAAITAKTGRTRYETMKTLLKDNPQGRLVTPDEVAAAALWLASEEAGSVNGQAIVIDGGETA
jgi:NAD(P)-dependent dehydrogenase (short-subunit alcohol dehydrogenase family)